MDLLERYLQAIGQYLPADSRQDTMAELRANLLEQMDARAEELDRPLVESDVAAMLRQHGKPELVALRYLPQRSLIGPTIFPFYTLTLARVLPLVVLVTFLARGIEYVSRHDESAAHALGGFALGLASSLLMSAAIITAIFAGIEWSVQRGKLKSTWNEWDPAKLPAVKAENASGSSLKAMWKRVLDLAIHCVWMAYILWVPWHPFWIVGPGVFYLDRMSVTLSPAWHTFYVLLLVLLTVQLVIKLVALSPWMTKGRDDALKLATGLLGIIVVGSIAWVGTYFVASGTAANAAQIASINHGLSLAFRIAFVVSVAGFAIDIWKYGKLRIPAQRLAF